MRAHPAATPRFPGLRSSPTPAAQTFVIDKTGEMPEGVVAPPRSAAGTPKPALLGNGHGAAGAAAPPPSRFAPYDLDVDEPRPGTPQPIKVTRAKKKASGGAKKEKKRTPKTDGTSTPAAAP